MSDTAQHAQKTLQIAGLPVHLFGLGSVPKNGKVTVLFFLHGRLGRYQDHLAHFTRLLAHARSQQPSSDSHLVIVTFDQRNHGHRLVSKAANATWQDKPANPSHAMDMHAIQVGTAQDVSLIMDYLQAYLTDYQLKRYLCAGVSLGGHATWLALSMDHRLQAGCPIIGCPDYLTLMQGRARTLQADGQGLLTEHLFPSALQEAVAKLDPKVDLLVSKRILVLSGARDKLVPFQAGRAFVERLQAAQAAASHPPNGWTQVIVEEGVGHRCSPAMVEHLAVFVAKEMRQEKNKSNL